MNKIGCFKMYGMLNFHGLNLWWMNKGRCIKQGLYQNKVQGNVVNL